MSLQTRRVMSKLTKSQLLDLLEDIDRHVEVGSQDRAYAPYVLARIAELLPTEHEIRRQR